MDEDYFFPGKTRFNKLSVRKREKIVKSHEFCLNTINFGLLLITICTINNKFLRYLYCY